MKQRIVIDGKVFVSDNPVIKTVHGKTGEVVIGGFYEDGTRCCICGKKIDRDDVFYCMKCAEEIGDDRR